MKAASFSQFGGPEVLEIVDLPEPHAGPGQIRIAVYAAGINATDWKVRQGQMGGDLPQTGHDVAGVVDEVGEGVTNVAVGDRVFGLTDGEIGTGVAERALLSFYAPIPSALGFVDAAGLPVALETATRSLDALGVRSGSTLLINGAAGGIGSTAVQLAVARGARVIGTASPANHDYLRSLGTEPVAYGPGMTERVPRPRTGRRRPSARRRRQRRATRAHQSRRKHRACRDARRLRRRAGARGDVQLRQLRPRCPGTGRGRPPDRYWALLAPGRADLPLAEVGEAHRAVEEGHVRGRVVVLVS